MEKYDIENILEANSVQITELFDAMILENTDIHELIHIMSNFDENHLHTALNDSLYTCRLFSLETIMKCNSYADILWLIDNSKYATLYVQQTFLIQLNEAILCLDFNHSNIKSNNVLQRYIVKKLNKLHEKSNISYPYSKFGHNHIKEYDMQILQRIINGYSFLDVVNSISDTKFCEYINSTEFFSDSILFQHIYQDDVFFNISPAKQYAMLSIFISKMTNHMQIQNMINILNIASKFFIQILCTKEIQISQKYMIIKLLQNIVNSTKLKYYTNTLFPYIAEITLQSCKTLTENLDMIKNARNDSKSYTEFMINMTCAGIPLNDKISMFYVFSQTVGNKMKKALREWCEACEILDL